MIAIFAAGMVEPKVSIQSLTCKYLLSVLSKLTNRERCDVCCHGDGLEPHGLDSG